MEDTEVRDGSIETRDLRLATWLYLNSSRLSAITPIDPQRCSYAFTMSNSKLGKLMEQWANGSPMSDVREVINAYLYLVHRGKDMLRARRGIQ